jgi:hypothetical protein
MDLANGNEKGENVTRPCHVSKMYPPRTFEMLSVHVCKIFPAHAQVGTLQIYQFILNNILNAPKKLKKMLRTFR